MEWLDIIPESSRLDIGGNPDLDRDPRIFEGILSLRYWQWWFGTSPV